VPPFWCQKCVPPYYSAGRWALPPPLDAPKDARSISNTLTFFNEISRTTPPMSADTSPPAAGAAISVDRRPAGARVRACERGGSRIVGCNSGERCSLSDGTPPGVGREGQHLPPRGACGVTCPTRPAPLDPTCVARAAAAPWEPPAGRGVAVRAQLHLEVQGVARAGGTTLPPARPSASPSPGNLPLATRCRFPAPQTPAASSRGAPGGVRTQTLSETPRR